MQMVEEALDESMEFDEADFLKPWDEVAHGGQIVISSSVSVVISLGRTEVQQVYVLLLALLDRFGPGGSHEHPEVVEMLARSSGSGQRVGGVSEFMAKMKRIRDEVQSSQDEPIP